MANPFAWSSFIASFNCGTEALMLGSLMIFASGFFANSPSSVNASLTRWSGFKKSEKFAKILAASEMSRVSTTIFDGAVNALTIGRKDRVASAGASSVLV